MLRFTDNFHQSDLKHYHLCPRSFWFDRVLGLDRDKKHISAVAGVAGHDTVEAAHIFTRWDEVWLWEVFREKYEIGLAKMKKEGIEIVGEIDQDRWRAMLAGYASKAYNREMEIVLAEAPFLWILTTPKTTYTFEGRIDQLGRIPADTLREEFGWLTAVDKRDSFLVHRDLKFGRRKETGWFNLALDVQIDTYACAIKDGTFLPHGSDESIKLNLIPDYHIRYHLEDLIPYANNSGTYLKDENGNHVPCDIVPEPCLLGVQENTCQGKRKSCPKQLDKKGQPYTTMGPYIKDEAGNFVVCDIVPEPCSLGRKENYCQGKRSFCTKQRRGPGMYFTVRPADKLANIPKDLARTCAQIKMANFPRIPGDMCHSYCNFRTACEVEVLEEINAAWLIKQ